MNRLKRRKYIQKLKYKQFPNDGYVFEITLISISVISLLLSFLLVEYAKNHTNEIENIYSRAFYQVISGFLTKVSNLFAFSLGEILIGLQVVFIVYLCISIVFLFIKGIIQKDLKRGLRILFRKILTIVTLLSFNILFFQVAWGLNNYRQDIQSLVDLNNEPITIEELSKSYTYLVETTNQLKEQLDQNSLPTKKEIRLAASDGYKSLSEEYSFIDGARVVVKPLLISPWFTKSGYTGIFLPFFTEANVNIDPLIFKLPFTASHEIAHNKGFASEDEANFIGYLAASYHDDAFYRYSANLSMLTYVGNSLYSSDQQLYITLASKRSEAVLMDLQEDAQFWKENMKEKVNKIHNKVNDAFLKANNQPEGVITYSRVTELFVKAYIKGLIKMKEL